MTQLSSIAPGPARGSPASPLGWHGGALHIGRPALSLPPEGHSSPVKCLLLPPTPRTCVTSARVGGSGPGCLLITQANTNQARPARSRAFSLGVFQGASGCFPREHSHMPSLRTSPTAETRNRELLVTVGRRIATHHGKTFPY